MLIVNAGFPAFFVSPPLFFTYISPFSHEEKIPSYVPLSDHRTGINDGAEIFVSTLNIFLIFKQIIHNKFITN